MIIVLMFFMFFQQAMEDHSIDKTHKAKHSTTTYYMMDKKTYCGTLKEFRNGSWVVYKDKTYMRAFDNEKEATKFIGLYCPIAGTSELK